MGPGWTSRAWYFHSPEITCRGSYRDFIYILTAGVIPSTVQTLYDNPYTFDIDYTSQTHLCTQAGVVSDCNFPGGVIPNATFAGTTCSDVVKEVM